MQPITFPARPINGGKIELSRPKAGIWRWEPKYNGWRALVHAPSGQMWNRQGMPLSISKEFQTALGKLKARADRWGHEWFDCEALERRHNLGRGTLFVLDVLPLTSRVGATYLERRSWMTEDLKIPNVVGRPENDEIYCPESFGDSSGETSPLDRLRLFNLLATMNMSYGCIFFEGMVAKRADSIYPMQLNSPDQHFPFWVKHRFI